MDGTEAGQRWDRGGTKPGGPGTGLSRLFIWTQRAAAYALIADCQGPTAHGWIIPFPYAPTRSTCPNKRDG
eukprot:10788088-Lingulodinium_polyedra.AAC.1